MSIVSFYFEEMIVLVSNKMKNLNQLHYSLVAIQASGPNRFCDVP